MSTPKIIYKTALAVFKGNKMIMVRSAKKPEVFYTLGGKIDTGETGVECLHREIKEEVDTEIKEGSLRFLKKFEAPAHGKENTIVSIELYTGELVGEPRPSREIAEIQYFNTATDKKHLTPLTIEIFGWLKGEGYIG